MSGAPIGEIFKTTINGVERDYHILPRVFSSETMEALGRVYKKAVREQTKDNLALAVEIRKMDQEVYKDFMEQVTKAATERVFVGYEQSIDALSTRSGIITALLLNCPQCQTEEDAKQLVDSCPNVLELMNTLIMAGNEALIAAKNSISPETKLDVESEEIPEEVAV